MTHSQLILYAYSPTKSIKNYQLKNVLNRNHKKLHAILLCNRVILSINDNENILYFLYIVFFAQVINFEPLFDDIGTYILYSHPRNIQKTFSRHLNFV